MSSGWVIEALIASSLLMALVLLIRRPVASQFGPRVAYCLWLIPALRMVLPPLPQSWLFRPVEVAPEIATTAVAFDAPLRASVDWFALGLAVWAAGAALHFALHFWAYRRFAKRAIAAADFMHEVDPGAIQVYATPEVSGPLAMGLLRASILVPADFEQRYDRDERAFALAHEIAHHRRGDLKVNLGALALLSLHWFNPLAHHAYRAFRTDQELACDATIMADADADSRHAYGRALVKSACDNLPLATCALDRKQELKRRLKMMQPNRLTALRTGLGALGAAALLTGGMLITGTAGADPVAKEPKLVRIAQAERPVAPAAPVAPVEAAAPAEAVAHVTLFENGAREAAKSTAEQAERASAEARADAALTRHEATREAADAAREAANEARQQAIEAASEAQEDAHDAAREAERQAALAHARLSADDRPVQLQLVRTFVLQNGDSVVQQAVFVGTDKDVRAVLMGALERAGLQVRANTHLSDDQKARALEAIKAKLAALRNAEAPLL